MTTYRIKAPKRRSAVFWILIVSCLVLALTILTYVTYLYYQVYFGTAAKGLSENMGAENYNAYISETVGATTIIFMFTTLLSFITSMVLLIKEKYSIAKFFLVISLLSLGSNIGYSVEKFEAPIEFENFDIVPISIFTVVIAFIFAYLNKYQKQLSAN